MIGGRRPRRPSLATLAFGAGRTCRIWTENAKRRPFLSMAGVLLVLILLGGALPLRQALWSTRSEPATPTPLAKIHELPKMQANTVSIPLVTPSPQRTSYGGPSDQAVPINRAEPPAPTVPVGGPVPASSDEHSDEDEQAEGLMEAPANYVIAAGDTLSGIAAVLGVEVEEIIDLNNITQPDDLSIGQRLLIPQDAAVGRPDNTTRRADRLSILWPAYGRITCYFGERGSYWSSGWHAGLDIAGDVGDPVVAVADGTVITTSYGWNRGLGNIVKIDHGAGYATLYAHLSVLHVEQGDRVRRGQLIGEIGSTGVSTGPHLHFEIHVNGTPVDPLRYLP